MTIAASVAPALTAPTEAPRQATGLRGAIVRLAAGKAGAVVIALTATPVLTRLYTPNNFGTLAILTTLVSVLAPSATLSYVRALPLVPNASDRRGLVTLCGVVLLLGTVAVALAALAGSKLLPTLYGVPELETYIFVLPLMFFISGAEQIATMLLNCDRKYGLVATRDVITAVTSATLGILAGLSFLGSRTAGLLIGVVAGMLVGATYSGTNALKLAPPRATDSRGLRIVWQASTDYRAFPLLANWASTLNAVTQGLPVILLGLFFPLQVVAFYAIASRLTTLPITLFTGASNQAYYIEAADALTSGHSAQDATLDLLHILSLLTTFPLLLTAILAPAAFEILLGSEWRDAGVYCQILVPWIAVAALASPLTGIYALRNRQGEFLATQTLLCLGRSAALVFGGMVLKAPIPALVLFTLVGVALNMSIFWRCTALANTSRRRAVVILLQNLVEAASFLLPAGLATCLHRTDVITLLLCTAGTAAYVAFLARRHRCLLQRIVSPLARYSARHSRSSR